MADALTRRLLAIAAGAAVLAVAVALRWVDPGRCAALLFGGDLTEANALAVVGGVCWLGAGVIIAVLTSGAWHHAAPPASVAVRRALLLGGALIVLALGIARHVDAYGVCCADAAGAQQAEQHVR